MEEIKPHFVLVTFPAQGHINPALQFAKRLLRSGANVTFLTSVAAYTLIDKANIPLGLAFSTFSHGYDHGFKAIDGDVINFTSSFRKRGTESLESLFEGKQVSCVVYTLLLPWAAEVARHFNVPSAVLWIQPAIVFDVYYYYFNGYGDVINDCEKDPSWSLELPNLPFKLKARDLPSFLLPSSPFIHNFGIPSFQEQIQELKREKEPKILVNTFEALEVDALKSVERFNLISVGPLLPSAFLDGKDPSDKSKDKDYMKWLNSQEEYSSVIYVSFGSMSVLSKAQMEQLAKALIQTHRPFLWVIRDYGNKEKKLEGDDDELMSCLMEQGLIVPWCSQVEVLSHPSVGCFVTHCGWNSTLESITCGVPMVAFPQWTDQTTNAKMVEEVWKTGLRVKVSEEEGGLVKSEEIKRCLEEVMESEEMRENAKKWKQLAVEAVQEGGSSDNNLKAFIGDLLTY